MGAASYQSLKRVCDLKHKDVARNMSFLVCMRTHMYMYSTYMYVHMVIVYSIASSTVIPALTAGVQYYVMEYNVFVVRTHNGLCTSTITTLLYIIRYIRLLPIKA